MVKDSNTENRIIEAARIVFLKKGMTGARMQEIADEAGINKALLHYYFRSKDKLFEHILNEVIRRIAGGLKQMFTKEMTVIERLDSLVDIYVSVLNENRYLPLFVLTEINQNPDRFVRILKEHVVGNMGDFIVQVQQEAEQGLIRPVHPFHLLLSVLGMIIFPIAVYPLMSKISDGAMDHLIKNLLEERREFVKDFVKIAITPPKS